MNARQKIAIDRPLHNDLGVTAISSVDGVGIITVKLKEYVLNPHGFFHGGVIYLLSDICAYYGLLSVLDESTDAVTHDIQVSVMKSAKLNDLVKFESKVVRLGSRVCFLETVATVAGKTIATAKITKSLIDI